MRKFNTILLSVIIIFLFSACSGADEDNTVILRVCNWEEYIDEGGWDESELIELDNGKKIIGENAMYDDFEEWYYETYGIKVKVEYSCAGTNEDLYNQLTLGDVFDLVCPSDYMIMKLMAEDKLVKFSPEFFDTDNGENYYSRGVSPYIKKIFDENEINGEAWGEYSAGYMWGTTGIVYNTEEITREEASNWELLRDPAYKRRVTIKDNVRDAYFAALAIHKRDKITDDGFVNREDYVQALAAEMNDTSDDVISAVEDILRDIKENAYSFETDSGKADMVTGKVLANYQWSGDAVYTIEQAAEDDVELCYEVPREGGNLWFDGWVMLKAGIGEDARKQHAAEAFVNFVSIPENAVRNMNYIGYTSVIAGCDDPTMFDYARWYFGAEEDEEENEEENDAEQDAAEENGAVQTIDYDISYFFGGEGCADGSYVIEAASGQEYGALGAQYPSLDIIRRCAIMEYFDNETYEKINRMWINVRCFNIWEFLSGGNGK